MADAELLASLKELREAAAAMGRVIAEHGDDELVDELIAELERCGIAHGFGARADAVIAKAEGVQ